MLDTVKKIAKVWRPCIYLNTRSLIYIYAHKNPLTYTQKEILYDPDEESQMRARNRVAMRMRHNFL